VKQKSAEDYLRTIYSLYEKEEDKGRGVKSVDVSKGLNISKPSVSEMLKKLSRRGLIEFEPYSNIFLTNRGMKGARRVMHNHRVIEVFLRKVLGYELSKVHEEAHKLEHAFSEESIKRLDRFLKNPKVCPHGKTIH